MKEAHDMIATSAIRSRIEPKMAVDRSIHGFDLVTPNMKEVMFCILNEEYLPTWLSSSNIFQDDKRTPLQILQLAFDHAAQPEFESLFEQVMSPFYLALGTASAKILTYEDLMQDVRSAYLKKAQWPRTDSQNGFCGHRNHGRVSLMNRLKMSSSRSHSTTMLKAGDYEPKWLLIDAEDCVVGRLATEISSLLRGKHQPFYTPHCDSGDFVIVINASKVQFTGNKWQSKTYQTYSHYAGGQKIIPAKEMLLKKPEEIIHLAVKRMMPKGPLGYQQLKKLKIFADSKHEHQAQKPIEYRIKG
jgi:large subunit ribosomal protein L13